jgi:DNA-binding PadR family transcriptional regulator
LERPKRTIGETKLKILAIIQNHQNNGACAHGYEIWKTLQRDFHTYMDASALRNVYRHLHDLSERRLINRALGDDEENVAPRQMYSLTELGKELKDRFQRYLEICNENDVTH